MIWADGEAMQFKVISRVGDDAQLTLRECAVETVGKLCATKVGALTKAQLTAFIDANL